MDTSIAAKKVPAIFYQIPPPHVPFFPIPFAKHMPAIFLHNLYGEVMLIFLSSLYSIYSFCFQEEKTLFHKDLTNGKRQAVYKSDIPKVIIGILAGANE